MTQKVILLDSLKKQKYDADHDPMHEVLFYYNFWQSKSGATVTLIFIQTWFKSFVFSSTCKSGPEADTQPDGMSPRPEDQQI